MACGTNSICMVPPGKFCFPRDGGKICICKYAFFFFFCKFCKNAFANLMSHGISQLSPCASGLALCFLAPAGRQSLKSVPRSLPLSPALLKKTLMLRAPLQWAVSSLPFTKGASNPPCWPWGTPSSLQEGTRAC